MKKKNLYKVFLEANDLTIQNRVIYVASNKLGDVAKIVKKKCPQHYIERIITVGKVYV